MTKTRSTRRAFFASGGALVGAGVATAVGASALKSGETQLPMDEQLKQLRLRLAGLEDREAIRQLHLAFMTLIGQQSHASAADLFEDPAQLRVFTDQYRNQNGSAMHGAYRQSTSQQRDEVKLADDRLSATATFHVEVEVCTPVQGDCTAAKMARLQGNVADRRWEGGRFEASYVQTHRQWKIASLRYLAS
jgi:hypothetical protein